MVPVPSIRTWQAQSERIRRVLRRRAGCILRGIVRGPPRDDD